jgi:hypothetical protein
MSNGLKGARMNIYVNALPGIWGCFVFRVLKLFAAQLFGESNNEHTLFF